MTSICVQPSCMQEVYYFSCSRSILGDTYGIKSFNITNINYNNIFSLLVKGSCVIKSKLLYSCHEERLRRYTGLRQFLFRNRRSLNWLSIIAVHTWGINRKEVCTHIQHWISILWLYFWSLLDYYRAYTAIQWSEARYDGARYDGSKLRHYTGTPT